MFQQKEQFNRSKKLKISKFFEVRAPIRLIAQTETKLNLFETLTYNTLTFSFRPNFDFVMSEVFSALGPLCVVL